MATAVGNGRVQEVSGVTTVTPDPARSFVGFLAAVKSASSKQYGERRHGHEVLEKQYKTGYVTRSGMVTKAAMGETSGAIGGYAVPLDFTLALMDVIAEESFIYPRATVIPMAALTMQAPKVDVETASGTAGVTSLTGGINFTWGASQAPTEIAEPKFRQLQLTAWDLLGTCVVSNDFLSDIGPDGEDYLVRLFGRAAAWAAEFAFLQGIGSAGQMPLGIIPAPGTISVTRLVANQLFAADVANMVAKLLPGSWKSAIWACSPTVLGQLGNLGTYFINDGHQHEDGCQVGTLFTRPLFDTEKLPALGTKGDLVLFDPRLYVIGMRQEVLVDVSSDDPGAFQANQSVFRLWARLDGKPQVSKAVTSQDQTTTFSPQVVLL